MLKSILYKNGNKMKDFKKIYDIAMSNDQLNVALKAKELMIKLSENTNNTDNISLSDEEIERYIKIISNELSEKN